MYKIVPLLLLLLTGCNSDQPTTSTPITIEHQKSITDDFTKQDSSWSIKSGQWHFENGVLKQSATNERFPLILLEKEKLSDVDISVKFRPISGRIDASGGLVFRAVDKKNYFIVRANALEDNFRLYTFKNGRRSEIASATVTPPTLGDFHTIRVVAKGEHIQAYLDGKLYLDHYDSSFSVGYVGLWTKADSVTEFDNLKISKKSEFLDSNTTVSSLFHPPLKKNMLYSI
jgi:hypothetical protein